jgi:hypothetical protein
MDADFHSMEVGIHFDSRGFAFSVLGCASGWFFGVLQMPFSAPPAVGLLLYKCSRFYSTLSVKLINYRMMTQALPTLGRSRTSMLNDVNCLPMWAIPSHHPY